MNYTKKEPGGKYGLWVRKVGACGFVSRNKSTSLVGVEDHGGGCAWGRQGVWGRSLYLPLKFCCEAKTALRKNKQNKKTQNVIEQSSTAMNPQHRGHL